MLKDWIQKDYLGERKVKEYSSRFRDAQPFPHLELSQFLQQEKARALLKAIVKEPFQKKKADLFSFRQTQDLKGTKNEELQVFRAFLCSKEFIGYMKDLTRLPLKPGKVDLAGTLYEDTDYLLCHDDELEGRKIAFLLYLNDFTPRDGGSLGLMNSKFETVARITPKFNTLAFFEVSKKSFHEVEEVIGKKQRLALGGWLHDP